MIRVSAVAGVLVLALLASAGCADNLLKERPTTKAVRAGARPTFSAAGSAKGESSVCGAYRRQLRVVQLRQALKPAKAVSDELKAKELSLNAIIADACE
jgi:hypothetical protein